MLESRANTSESGHKAPPPLRWMLHAPYLVSHLHGPQATNSTPFATNDQQTGRRVFRIPAAEGTPPSGTQPPFPPSLAALPVGNKQRLTEVAAWDRQQGLLAGRLGSNDTAEAGSTQDNHMANEHGGATTACSLDVPGSNGGGAVTSN